MGSKNKKTKKAIISTVEAEPEPEATHGGGNKRGNKVITDARFAFSQTDPRFQTHTKQKSKVTIDSRFNRMFTDKNFSTSSTSIDKRGKAKRKDTPNPLKHYYHMDENEDKDEEEEVKERNEEAVNDEDESDKSSDEGEKERENKLKKMWEKLTNSEDSDSQSGSELEGVGDEDDDVKGDSDSDSDFDSDDEVYSEEEQEEEHVPEIDKETSRLAVVNMDWNQVNADDLYVLLSSFLPKGGQISSVSVYPSEFGLKRMEEEAVHGPVGLFDDDKKKNESDDNDDGDDKIDNENLRAYELSRLRYYYAVVECDSIATADYLYKTCDGVEFERSSNKLDLRFIPDSMEFKHAPPRDVAKEAPANYEGVDFQTRALQQSKIELTWDDDEPQRSKTLKRKFNADQLAELELKEFLASDESESDEDEDDDTTGDRSGKRQKKQDMYRALIQSGDGSDGDEEEEGQDMEVTFNTGLEDISKKILERRDKKSETVWEAYQRRKKEKKKARKNRSKDSSDDDSDTDREPTEEPNDFFVEDEPTAKEHKKASGKSGKKKKEAVETAEEEASRAELELLLADDNGETTGVKGYNLKRKKGKGKKGKDILDEEKIPTVDYDDDRFSSLFTSHLFALDPTDPQYKRSAAHARQIAQKKHMEESNKQNGQTHVPSEVEPVNDEPVRAGDSSTKKEKFEISSLVKSIKMKSKKVPVPSNGKMSGRKGK